MCCDNYTWWIWIPPPPSLVFSVLNTLSCSYSVFASNPPSFPYHPTSFYTKVSSLLDLNDKDLLSLLKQSLGTWPVSVLCRVSYTLQDKESVGGMELVTYCFWHLNLINYIHGNLRTCSLEFTSLFTLFWKKTWKWAVGAETSLINDSEWVCSQPRYNYGNIWKNMYGL